MSTRATRLSELLASGSLRRGEIRSIDDAGRRDLWTRGNLSGRLTEISGVGASAPLTAAMGLVLQTQREGEPVAWVTTPLHGFYPPDASDYGIDLDSLAVVRVPTSRNAARAAERLVRSGAFGLIVLDLGTNAFVPTALQGRLVSLAQKHDTAIVCLTEKPAETASLGSMVSLRAEVLREAAGVDPEDGRAMFRCKVHVIKDKRRGPSWSHDEVVRGPAGLR